ncbi:MAG: ferredoxin [Candidatus Aenigmatarchaeota archaeon]
MVEVDEDACIGCGSCVAVAPDIFELGDNGKAKVKEDEATEEAKEAATVCPVDAITV